MSLTPIIYNHYVKKILLVLRHPKPRGERHMVKKTDPEKIQPSQPTANPTGEAQADIARHETGEAEDYITSIAGEEDPGAAVEKSEERQSP
jgi:hypothetical protein